MGWFTRELIPQLCREGGNRWVVISKEPGSYRLRNNDGRRPVYITVSQRAGTTTVLFQAFFPVRFSLEREPRGLFARVLMRNFNLGRVAWSMYIGESSEACLTLWTNVPKNSLDATLLHVVCNEMAQEIRELQDELHEKFRYGPEPSGGNHDNVLASATERYFASVRETLLPQPPMRYRLPGK